MTPHVPSSTLFRYPLFRQLITPISLLLSLETQRVKTHARRCPTVYMFNVTLKSRNWKNMWKPLQLRQSCTGMHGIGIKTSKGLVFDSLTRIRFENLNHHHIIALLRKYWCSIFILPPVVHFKHGPLSISIFPGFCFWRFNKNYLFTYRVLFLTSPP